MTESSAPTHAGGVVYRAEQNGRPEFLLVTARRPPHDWVFPKGHIERGETPEEAAIREVYEESGVRAAIVEPLEEVRLQIRGEEQIIRYFLMRALEDGGPGEGRHAQWLSSVDAMACLPFPEARGSLRKALDALDNAERT